jgi:uncharacterized repeat protein (TIGR03803 family)
MGALHRLRSCRVAMAIFMGRPLGGGSGTGGGGVVFRISSDGSYTNLHSFPSYPKDGYSPVCALAQVSDGHFYGTTYGGGTKICGCGTIFRISPSGQYKTLYSFAAAGTGALVAGLVQGNDGNFYGTA